MDVFEHTNCARRPRILCGIVWHEVSAFVFGLAGIIPPEIRLAVRLAYQIRRCQAFHTIGKIRVARFVAAC